ncbi:ABC transporter ATP-binding protein [Vallitalea sp.]|jgi:ATP-binding cassette subfamily B protein|uniref:ABC transporter ATP-binding protein n=1 Tax=Vallitalea sp. TaxID=1882829 RepID=UPI0025E7718D|nr:ABC transporter ATP-binding protein [Vallitalea sp.]MCT4687865.1 ABC transporter ATP-binding protein/permease [Vallitalea sp.]
MKKKNWLSIVSFYAKECKVKLVVSVFFAIISVFGGIVPYMAVYRIFKLFFDGAQTVDNIILWSGIGLAGYVVKVAFHGFSTVLSHISAYKILESIRLSICDKLMKVPLGVVLNESAGKIKNTIIDRVETIELPLAHMIPESLSNLVLSICVLIYLISIDWRMALASLISVFIGGIAYGIVMKTYNKKYDDYMESSNYVNGVIVEYIEGIQVIKAFNQSAKSYEKFESAVKEFKNYTLDWFRSTWKLVNFASSALPTSLLGTLPIGLYLYIKGSLDPAELTMCLLLSLGIVGALTNFTILVNDLKAIQFALRDAYEYVGIDELPNVSKEMKLNSYNIEFNDVSFSYDDEKVNDESKSALSDINLNLREGQFTAFVGASGSGKSTIARMLVRFWDVTKGEIKIDGVNIKDIPIEQLMDSISYVTQDNFLFNCSLMENIRLGNIGASDKEVIRASKAACCHEFIEKLDNKYETAAGEAGGKLSGGEKQRIAIARAILKNAPIIILDEATAFTDPENEDKIQKSIAELTKGKTLLVIAHRLSTIKNADNIVILDNGKIKDIGTHDELLSKSSMYKNMWDAHIGSKHWAASSSKSNDSEVQLSV